jgi:hypothetical protein
MVKREKQDVINTTKRIEAITAYGLSRMYAPILIIKINNILVI